MRIDPNWLAPTWFIDSDSDVIAAFTNDAAGDATDPRRSGIPFGGPVGGDQDFFPHTWFSAKRMRLQKEQLIMVSPFRTLL